MIKRNIRLKEVGVNVNRVCEPSVEYLKNCPKLNKDESYYLSTDGEGNQFSVIGNKSNREIFLLGASTVESMYIKHSMRPHSVLEKILLENGCDYEVKNLGASGTQVLNIINQIINKLSQKQGALVIITLPSNDFGPLRYKQGYFSTHLHHATVLPAKDLKVEKNSNLDLNLYTRNLGLIKAICEQLELNLIFTSICYTTSVDDLKILNNLAREFCIDKNIPFLDLEEEFSKNQDFFYDKLHFLPKGSQFYASKIFDFIKSDLIIDSKKKLEIYDFKYEGSLSDSIIWSEVFDVSSQSEVKLIIDFDHIVDSNNPALITVDYHCKPIKASLTKSPNDEIGYYKYVSGIKGRRIEEVYDITVPVNCTKIKIGLRAWGRKGIVVHNAEVIVLSH
ncbi:lysophospholipase L1-like esterase [Acinetobacter calcoaceticus]|uniref:Lysophospholipase L1-like esterase n=1 Tax=Acinetobacter calcoaceticus TaxID=471 RepID=A0A4R1XWG8_ACICA|nr:lysophospholipase L1-like esterase [Acinetobacter calcoaceticus]